MVKENPFSNNVNQEKQQAEQDKLQETKQEKFKQEVIESLERFFDSTDSKRKKRNYLLGITKKFVDAKILGDNVMKEIEQCLYLEDKDKFVNQMLLIWNPVLEFGKDNLAMIEKIRRESFVEQGKFTKLNEVLSYGTAKDNVHIHFAPAKEIIKENGMKGTVKLVVDGFKELAKVVESNEKIKKITATSWIVGEHPKIIESFGFTVTGEAGKLTRSKHFQGEKRKVAEAEMSREEFLSKYL